MFNDTPSGLATGWAEKAPGLPRIRLYYPVMAKEECARKMAILEDVRTAMAALMEIHNDEVEALLKEDFDAISELRRKLGAARANKAELIELYREHVETHGC